VMLGGAKEGICTVAVLLLKQGPSDAAIRPKVMQRSGWRCSTWARPDGHSGCDRWVYFESRWHDNIRRAKEHHITRTPMFHIDWATHHSERGAVCNKQGSTVVLDAWLRGRILPMFEYSRICC
jgi:hypothetical protein